MDVSENILLQFGISKCKNYLKKCDFVFKNRMGKKCPLKNFKSRGNNFKHTQRIWKRNFAVDYFFGHLSS